MLLPLAAQSEERSEPLKFLGNESLPPMISLHEGRPEGVVVDLANAVAEKAGLSVKIERRTKKGRPVSKTKWTKRNGL